MTTVLVTGFEPFGGGTVNPSWEAVKRLRDTWAGPETLLVERLPVEFAASSARLSSLVSEHSPDLVIATGLAAGRTAITPERVAINVDDARIPDNAGAQPIDEPIALDGPAAYFTGLPVKAIVAALAAEGIPAAVSQSAGTYVCNHVMYTLLHAGVRGGFIHVPSSDVVDAAAAGRALELAVRVALESDGDVRAVGGAEE